MMIYDRSRVGYSYTLSDGTAADGDQPSNTVPTEIISDSVIKAKSGDKTFLRAGETSVHTVDVINNSTAVLLSPVFSDKIGEGAKYVSDSVIVNGVSKPGFDPAAGFALPDIAPGERATVSFAIIADTPVAHTSVTGAGQLRFSIEDPISGTRTLTQSTNPVTVILIGGGIAAVNSVDKAYAVQGDILHYTSVVTNTGNAQAHSLVFYDPIPAGTVFVTGSVTVDGTPYAEYDPAAGFALPALAPGQSATVGFDVRVV